MNPNTFDSNRLKEWFLRVKRDLPWRRLRTPYAVWVSEIMLQQTQVSVVIDYFNRWMTRFPTISSLAQAESDEVIKYWEGLGYYSRARNLHAGAKQIMEQFKGELPSTAEELKGIKGIGDYTVGAILSFAFQKRAAAVDGNAIRVLSRYYGIEDEVDKPSVKRQIAELNQAILPDHEPWLVVEGIMELGASHCSRAPQCSLCPLQKSCHANAKGIASELPRKGKKVVIERLWRDVAVISSEGHYLVMRGEKGKVMADLYEFPYFEGTEQATPCIAALHSHSLTHKELLPAVNHSFTRFRVTLRPSLYALAGRPHIPGYIWITHEALTTLPFSSGHRRIAEAL